jgi:hypothetical protein
VVSTDQAWSKLGHAEKHLGVLDDEVIRYQERPPHVPRIQPSADPQIVPEATTYDLPDYLAIQVVVSEFIPPPPIIALVAGDVLFNARASLDYLAWQMVHASGTEPNESTQFPVFRKTGEGNPDRHPHLLQPGAEERFLTVLDRLQPYQCREPESHPLWVLHNLNRIDKHRHLNVLVTAASDYRMTAELPDGKVIERHAKAIYRKERGEMKRIPLQDGAPLGGFSRAEIGPIPHTEVKVDCEPKVEVVLGELGTDERGTASITDQLGELLSFIRTTVFPPLIHLLS